MDRLFLDANVLFSAAWREDAGVARLWSLDGVELVTSDFAVEEARRNLPDDERIDRLDLLLERVNIVQATMPDPASRPGIELPGKDWPIIGGAIAAGTTHLITGDARDFGTWFGRKLLGVLVLTPADSDRDAPTYCTTREAMCMIYVHTCRRKTWPSGCTSLSRRQRKNGSARSRYARARR